MTQNVGPSPRYERGRFCNAAAAGLAVIGVVALALVLGLTWAGRTPWAGLSALAMVALPVAFVLLGVGVLRAVLRRRNL